MNKKQITLTVCLLAGTLIGCNRSKANNAEQEPKVPAIVNPNSIQTLRLDLLAATQERYYALLITKKGNEIETVNLRYQTNENCYDYSLKGVPLDEKIIQYSNSADNEKNKLQRFNVQSVLELPKAWIMKDSSATPCETKTNTVNDFSTDVFFNDLIKTDENQQIITSEFHRWHTDGLLNYNEDRGLYSRIINYPKESISTEVVFNLDAPSFIISAQADAEAWFKEENACLRELHDQTLRELKKKDEELLINVGFEYEMEEALLLIKHWYAEITSKSKELYNENGGHPCSRLK